MAKLVLPDYFEYFFCTGSSCEDNCCKNWRIDIDRESYNKMALTQEREFRKKFEQIKINSSEKRTDRYYAVMPLDKDRRCLFLDSDKLCTLYKNYSEEIIGYVCRTYPRVTVKNGNSYYISIFNSCPEKTKLFFEKKRIEYIQKELDDRMEKSYIFREKKSDKEFHCEAIEKTLNLLNNRELNSFSKIAMLYYAVKENNTLFENYYISDIKEEIRNNTIIKKQVDIYYSMASVLLKNMSPTLKEFYRYFIITCSKIKQDSDGIVNYINGYNNYYKESIKLYGNYLENYIEDSIYSSLITAESYADFLDKIRTVILNYTILKITIVGNMINKNKIEINEIKQIIYKFSRVAEHGSFYKKEIAKIADLFFNNEAEEIIDILN